jgi:hypothetical protein
MRNDKSRSRLPADRIERLRRSALDGSARTRPSKNQPPASSTWKRESWTLPRAEARAKAREFFQRYPKAAYWSEVESWRVLDDDRIEFTMRRLPSAD